MNQTGKGSYFCHLRQAAELDREADRLERQTIYSRGHVRKLRAEAEAHRTDAKIIDLERRAAA